MIKRIDLINVFSELSRSYEKLVFWKHLERGLGGSGDIDAFAAETDLEKVSSSFVGRVFEQWPRALAAVTCSHVKCARINLIIFDSLYPRILEFDVGSFASRLSVPWVDADVLVRFSEKNSDGIRILTPGAQAIVLLILYGLSSNGDNRLRDFDHEAIMHGVRHDADVCRLFCKRSLPKNIAKSMIELVDALATADWSKKRVRRVYAEFFRSAISRIGQGKLLSLFAAFSEKFKPSCSVRRLILENNRVSPYENWRDLLAYCESPGHKTVLGPMSEWR